MVVANPILGLRSGLTRSVPPTPTTATRVLAEDHHQAGPAHELTTTTTTTFSTTTNNNNDNNKGEDEDQERAGDGFKKPLRSPRRLLTGRHEARRPHFYLREDRR